jgi:hypothetical protein
MLSGVLKSGHRINPPPGCHPQFLDGLEELVGRNYRRLSLDTIVNQEKSEREEPQVFGH